MFDLDKKAQSEVIDELLSFLNERGKGKLEKMFADPEEVLGKGKGKINVSEKTFVIPLNKKKEDEEDYEDKEENKESLSDDVAHFEDIYKDNFDNVDNDDPYDEKYEDEEKEKEEDDDEDEESSKEKKLY